MDEGMQKECLNHGECVELIGGFSEDVLDDILMLEKKCFPLEWQYDDANEYYKKILEDTENINIFLKEESETVGYVLARFHDKEISELLEFDPGLNSEKDVFYIETIQIIPEKKGKGGGRKLLLAVCEEAKKRGISKFSIHARKINGLNNMIKKLFDGKINKVREIEKWEPACGEPYEYIEWFY